MKLNIGSGPKRIKGYTNVDALEWEGSTDVIHDLTRFPYPFQDESVEEILAIEFLEHIHFRKTHDVLRECWRILNPNGKIHIQVPDCGAMMKAYRENRISAIIPHKPTNEKEVLELMKKTGMLVHPDRWAYSFTGAGKHKYDNHLNFFTKERMEKYLEDTGFGKIFFIEDPLNWKIKVNCFKY